MPSLATLTSPPRVRGGRRWSGHAAELAGDTLAFYDRCEREQGGILATHVWGLPVWLVFDPVAIEEILVRHPRAFVKSSGLRSVIRAFGEGLLTSDGELWRHQRRLLQPVFQRRRIEGYSEHVQRATHALLARIEVDGPRNIHADVTELCFDALTRAMFGEEVGQVKELLAEAAESLHRFHSLYSRWIGGPGGILVSGFSHAITRLGVPEYTIDPTLLPTAHARVFRRVMREVDRYVYDLIRRRRSDPGDEHDLVTLLLEARDEHGQPLDERQIRDEVVTMFLAGHETGAAAISWALYLLAQHPAVQARLHDELELPPVTEPARHGHSEMAPYLKSVLSESLRLYPPAHRIGRRAIEPVTIAGFPLAAGTEVIISQWSVQRSARYYDDPASFRPERWTPELRARLPRFAWFPFGGGPRTCIGESFALMESRLVVSSLVRAFALTAPPGVSVLPYQGVTLLPEGNQMMLNLSRRTAEAASGSLPARAS